MNTKSRVEYHECPGLSKQGLEIEIDRRGLHPTISLGHHEEGELGDTAAFVSDEVIQGTECPYCGANLA